VDLRPKLIRLAIEQPRLRSTLVPILRVAVPTGFHGWKMSPSSMRLPGPQFSDAKPIPPSDVETAVEYLEEVHPGVLVAYSRGGALAMLALREAEGAKPTVIYVAPAWRRGWANATPPSTGGSILHGDRDNAVPLQHSCDLAQRTGLPLRVVPDANHVSILKHKTSPGSGKLVPGPMLSECVRTLPDWGTSGRGSPDQIQQQVEFQERLAAVTQQFFTNMVQGDHSPMNIQSDPLGDGSR